MIAKPGTKLKNKKKVLSYKVPPRKRPFLPNELRELAQYYINSFIISQFRTT